MVGIDLVDLSDPNLKARSDRTIPLISHPEDVFEKNQFWLLWTAKEAIFKSYRTNRRFDPKQIPVLIDPNALTFHSGKIMGKFVISENVIMAIAHHREVNPIFKIYRRRLKFGESDDVRNQLAAHCKREFGWDITIGIDADGLPIILSQNLIVSFTHHHNYIGFAIPNI